MMMTSHCERLLEVSSRLSDRRRRQWTGRELNSRPRDCEALTTEPPSHGAGKYKHLRPAAGVGVLCFHDSPCSWCLRTPCTYVSWRCWREAGAYAQCRDETIAARCRQTRVMCLVDSECCKASWDVFLSLQRQPFLLQFYDKCKFFSAEFLLRNDLLLVSHLQHAYAM